MRFGPYPVKHSNWQANSAPNWRRWLDGWGLVFPSVGIAVLAACLALPQSTMPNHLPLPALRAAELAAARTEQRDAADAVLRQPLGYAVRAVGESFRQLGRLAHQGENIDRERRERFRQFVATARRDAGDDSIRRLRAIQARLFVAAVARWERTGVENDDLVELGGDFLAVARELGWSRSARPARPRPALVLDEDERYALFLTRWNDLAGTGDDRALASPRVWSLLALRARLRLPLAELALRDLKIIERVERLDPEYPELLGQGLVFAQLGDRARAIAAFRAHLAAHPDGPYTLRARNHLVYAIETLNSDER